MVCPWNITNQSDFFKIDVQTFVVEKLVVFFFWTQKNIFGSGSEMGRIDSVVLEIGAPICLKILTFWIPKISRSNIDLDDLLTCRAANLPTVRLPTVFQRQEINNPESVCYWAYRTFGCRICRVGVGFCDSIFSLTETSCWCLDYATRNGQIPGFVASKHHPEVKWWVEVPCCDAMAEVITSQSSLQPLLMAPLAICLTFTATSEQVGSPLQPGKGERPIWMNM